jgi:hypothetical protein
MAGGGFMSGAHKSVSKNRALRKGRDNIFERKAPKSNFQPTQKEEETPLQIRQKFRNQLSDERAIDRRNSSLGFVVGLLVCTVVWISREPITQFLAWIAAGI